MIDPSKITNYNLTIPELEEHLMFWICAAGKTAKTAARSLNNLLTKWKKNNETPFDTIRKIINKSDLSLELKLHGIGCYNHKSKTFTQLVESNINLKTCSVDDLESFHGIGPKTARCFLMHSRPNQRLAGLDTHLLRFLSDLGFDVPKTTPTGKKYKKIENIFLNLADSNKQTPAKLDLKIWNAYSSKNKDIIDKLINDTYVH